MIKYIRLKAGRIISYDEDADDLDKPMIIHYPNEIESESYKVVDLCDEFIVDAKYSHRPYLFQDTGTPIDDPSFDSEEEMVFGAIWVTKEVDGEKIVILQPVIKLNQKEHKWEVLKIDYLTVGSIQK